MSIHVYLFERCHIFNIFGSTIPPKSLPKTCHKQKSVEDYGKASRVMNIYQSLHIPLYSLICMQSNMPLPFAAFMERTARSIIIPRLKVGSLCEVISVSSVVEMGKGKFT